MTDIKEIVGVWQSYLGTVDDWEKLVEGTVPKDGGCGLVYEVPNPINRPNESFAIADMRSLDVSEPHYHANGETEIYFVIKGAGKIAVGNELRDLAPDVVIVTPPDTLHCTLPNNELVLAVVNTPQFNADNYIPLDETGQAVAKMITALRAET